MLHLAMFTYAPCFLLVFWDAKARSTQSVDIYKRTEQQELPERLLLTYKTEEAEKGPEPVQIVEEKEKPQSVEEPREKKLLAVAGSLCRFLQSLFPFTSFVYLSVGIPLLGFTAGFKICLRFRWLIIFVIRFLR